MKAQKGQAAGGTALSGAGRRGRRPASAFRPLGSTEDAETELEGPTISGQDWIQRKELTGRKRHPPELLVLCGVDDTADPSLLFNT